MSSIAGLRSGGLPGWSGWFGVITSLTIFCFVLGYLGSIKWLGEQGIGALAFLTLPVWMSWSRLISVAGTSRFSSRLPLL